MFGHSSGGGLRVRACFYFLAAALLLAGGAPRAAWAQAGGLQGTIRDTLSNNLEGATVTVAAGPTRGNATTAADGTYQLPGLTGGAYTLVVQKSGYQDLSRKVTVLSGMVSTVDFTLTPVDAQDGTILGVVSRKGTGQEVGGALVTLTGAGQSQTFTTLDNGAFRFTNLAPGSYRLSVSRTGFISASRSRIIVRAGATTTFNFNLKVRSSSLATIQGTVKDTLLRKRAGVRVLLVNGSSKGFAATTNSKGVYRIRGIVPDTYDVRFTTAGFETLNVQNIVLLAKQRKKLDETLTALGAGTAVLNGHVMDAGGAFIAGAKVSLVSGPVTNRFNLADANGAYTLDRLPPGTYGVVASATGFTTSDPVSVTLAIGETKIQDLTLQLDPNNQTGKITGTVTDKATGAVLEGARVRVTEGPTVGQVVTTDDKGVYTLDKLPVGSYTLTFSLDGYRDLSVVEQVVVANQTTQVDAQLDVKTGGTLTGTVNDNLGNLVGGVQAQAFGPTGTDTTFTDEAGHYELHGLEPGIYTVRFNRTGYLPVTFANVTLFEGLTTLQNATLSPVTVPTGGLTGFVRDPANQPLQNATVEIFGPAAADVVRTDSNGQYVFSGLPGASGYTLRVSAPGLITQEKRNIVVAAGQTIQVNFTLSPQPGTGSISGTVRDASGQALTGATLKLVAGPQVGDTRVSGDQGRYSFIGLRPGSYVVEISAPGKKTQDATIAVRAGVTSVANFFLQSE